MVDAGTLKGISSIVRSMNYAAPSKVASGPEVHKEKSAGALESGLVLQQWACFNCFSLHLEA